MNVIKAMFLTMCTAGFQFLDLDQYHEIYSGFRWYNLSKEQVKVYAKSNISSSRMKLCKHALAKQFSTAEMEEWLAMNLDKQVFIYVVEGRMEGIPKEKILEYANPEMSVYESFHRYLRLLQEYSN